MEPEIIMKRMVGECSLSVTGDSTRTPLAMRMATCKFRNLEKKIGPPPLPNPGDAPGESLKKCFHHNGNKQDLSAFCVCNPWLYYM